MDVIYPYVTYGRSEISYNYSGLNNIGRDLLVFCIIIQLWPDYARIEPRSPYNYSN